MKFFVSLHVYLQTQKNYRKFSWSEDHIILLFCSQ
jgi:hypothetical protein